MKHKKFADVNDNVKTEEKVTKKTSRKKDAKSGRRWFSIIMFLCKLGFLCTAIFAIVLGKLVYCSFPEGQENTLQANMQCSMFKLVKLIMQLTDFLGYGDLHENIHLLQDEDTPDTDPMSATLGGVKTSRELINGVPVLIHRPETLLDDTNAPALVFLHGGGFVLLNPDVFDMTMYKFSMDSNIVVFSVQMRKPPAHPWPTGVYDCLSVVKELLRNGSAYHIDSTKIGLLGDSAGANLVIATAWNISHDVAQGKLPPLKYQVLHYPMLQAFDMLTPSHVDQFHSDSISNGYDVGGYFALYAGVAPRDIKRAAKAISENRHVPPEMLKNSKYAKYLDVKNLPPEIRKPHLPLPPITEPFDAEISAKVLDIFTDPMFSAIFADDLSGFPETFIHICEFDYLRDDGLFLHKRLLDAGVKSELVVPEGHYHGNILLYYPNFLSPHTSDDAIDYAVEFITRVLGTKGVNS